MEVASGEQELGLHIPSHSEEEQNRIVNRKGREDMREGAENRNLNLRASH